MPTLRLGVSLQPRWPRADATAALRAASHAEDLGFDHVAVAKALWSQRPADFDGPFTTLRGAHLGVPPATPAGSALWIGGHSDAALRRALRFGDGWYGTGVSPAELTDVRRRLHELVDGTGKAERFTLAAAAFLTPPGIPAITSAPGRPLGGDAPTAASVVDDLGRLAESGLTTCTLWLPIAAEHVERRWTGSPPKSRRSSAEAPSRTRKIVISNGPCSPRPPSASPDQRGARMTRVVPTDLVVPAAMLVACARSGDG